MRFALPEGCRYSGVPSPFSAVISRLQATEKPT